MTYSPGMTDTSETRPFDAKASEELLKKLHDLGPDDTLPVVLRVRAPQDQFESVLNECLDEVIETAAVLRTSVSEYDIYIDKTKGLIHARVIPNLARDLVQRDDLFWSVGWDSDRWR